MAHGRLSVAIIREVLAGQHDLVVKVAEGRRRQSFRLSGIDRCPIAAQMPLPYL